jgi:hypothetical protein
MCRGCMCMGGKGESLNVTGWKPEVEWLKWNCPAFIVVRCDIFLKNTVSC